MQTKDGNLFKIIFRASAERVQALPINLRYIYKRVFHKQTAPIYEHTTHIAPIHVATCSFVKNFVHSHLNGSVLFKKILLQFLPANRNLKNFQVELFMFPRTVFGSTKLSPDMMLTVWRLVED